MPNRIIWSPQAENDFHNIASYLHDNWDAKTVNLFIALVDHLVLLISNNPLQFPKINAEYNIRKCVVTKHNSIYYRVAEKQIEVLRIFDTRQDPDKLRSL